MKVLLIQAPLDGGEPPVYPLGLAVLAGALPGHEVRTFDPNVTPGWEGALEALVRAFAPDAVGISFRNMDSPNGAQPVSYYAAFKRLANRVRALTAAPIIVGGAAFSLFAGPVMADVPAIDCGVFLDGEATFARLLDHLDDPETVPSVFYRRDGRVAFSGRGDPPPPGAPERTAFSPADYAGVVEPEPVGVESKRGCALGCVYCPYPFLNGKQYRLREPEAVADEVAALARAGVCRFTFTDAVFNLPRDHAAEVCEALIRAGNALPWSAWFNERALDADLLDLAEAAGCRTLILSPDGFSDEVLRRLGKSLTMADLHRVYGLVRGRENLRVSYSFFRNPPGQTVGTFLRLARFCLRARRELGPRVSFFFSRLRVEPHTAIYDLALREGLIADERDLLRPVFYSQPSTAWLDPLFDLALRLRRRRCS